MNKKSLAQKLQEDAAELRRMCEGTLLMTNFSKPKVKCECDNGYLAVQDNGGEGVDYIECANCHPAYRPHLFTPILESNANDPQMNSYEYRINL